MKLLHLFEDPPDIITRSEGTLGIHRRRFPLPGRTLKIRSDNPSYGSCEASRITTTSHLTMRSTRKCVLTPAGFAHLRICVTALGAVHLADEVKVWLRSRHMLGVHFGIWWMEGDIRGHQWKRWNVPVVGGTLGVIDVGLSAFGCDQVGAAVGNERLRNEQIRSSHKQVAFQGAVKRGARIRMRGIVGLEVSGRETWGSVMQEGDKSASRPPELH
ncbi:hypothetical protein N7512_001559 [Penicillium capsulatum]|nr:hypothetical protein N7512_001559 [Penicillium capsulatum]